MAWWSPTPGTTRPTTGPLSGRKNRDSHGPAAPLLKFAATVDTVPPGPVGDLTAEAGPENGEVVLRLHGPDRSAGEQGLRLHVRYSTGGDFAEATDVDRWRIPRPKAPGTGQRVLIEGLTPGRTYTFFVQAYDESATPATSGAWTLPCRRPGHADASRRRPAVARTRRARPCERSPDVLRYWAAAEAAKINPVTGNRMDDGYTGTGADDYKKATPSGTPAPIRSRCTRSATRWSAPG